jgi:hypothetical protein
MLFFPFSITHGRAIRQRLLSQIHHNLCFALPRGAVSQASSLALRVVPQIRWTHNQDRQSGGVHFFSAVIPGPTSAKSSLLLCRIEE